MTTCKATKRNGEPCTLPALDAVEGLCWVHSSAHAEARRKGQSRGGRGNPETRAVKKLMDKLTDKVLAGEIPPPVAHAVVALQNIKLRSIELERKIKETEELEARLEALEDVLKTRTG